ncbi:MAG: ATP-binding protein [Euryarchaeota archaeon]|nr:ATP-binding protein [Euryarchaeota archaeon]
MSGEDFEARIFAAGGELPEVLKNLLGSGGMNREERNRLLKSYLGVRNLSGSVRTYRRYPVTFSRAISLALEELTQKAEKVERGRAEEPPEGAPLSVSLDDPGALEEVIFGGEFRLQKKKVRAVVESSPFQPQGLMVLGPDGNLGSDHISISVYTRKEEQELAQSLFEVVNTHVYEKNPLRGKAISVYGEEMDPGKVDWDDIAIPPYFQTEVEENILWPVLHRESVEAAKLRVPRGLMLEGERGMGKTLLSRIISRRVAGKSTFIKAKPSDVQRLGWDYLFDIARTLEPSILYLEDIEALAPNKEKFGLTTPALTDVLDYLDGTEARGNVFLLASTNVPEMVDFSLLDRPGRIDRRLVFDPSNKKDFGVEWKQAVFEIHLRGHKLAPGLTPTHLARMIEDVPYTGAHIEELIHTASLEAIRREGVKDPQALKGKLVLTEEDFRRAKERVERIVRRKGGPEVG